MSRPSVPMWVPSDTVGPRCGAIVPGTAFCGMPVFEITTPHSCFSRGATTGEGASGMMSWNLHCGALWHCEPTSDIQPHSWHEQTTEPCHKALVTNNLPLSFCTYHILWHELHLPHSLAQTLARTFASHAPTTFLSQLHQPHFWHELNKNSRENRHNCTYHILWHPPHAPCHELKKTAVRTGKANKKNNMSIRVQCQQIDAKTEPLKTASVSHTKPRRVNPNGHEHK